MRFDATRALAVLAHATGRADARFHPGQEEAIRHVVLGMGRLLVVQRTGWGKSLVYFCATRLLREAGQGPTLLVSPLIALMRDQERAAERAGLRAFALHSQNQEDWPDIAARVGQGEVDLLLVSPERLANQDFLDTILMPMAQRLGLLVVDEAHCISDWGHEFRTDYRRLGRLLQRLPPNLRVLATTATATDRVIEDLREVLGGTLQVIRGPLARPSLTLQTARMPDAAHRLAWLATTLPGLPGSGIIYTLTKRDAHRVASWLTSRGLAAAPYTGETGPERAALEQALRDDALKALVATPALGMGFDKPNLAFVIHYQAPASVIAWYQQVGRAGRAVDAAWGVLLGGEEDQDIHDFFIRGAFPDPEEVRQVLAALEAAPDGLSLPGLLRTLNLPQGRVEKALELLALESPAAVVKDQSRWRRTHTPLGDALWSRARRLTALRRRERDEMDAFLDLPFGAHMGALIAALDGPDGPLPPPPRPPLALPASPALVQEARTWLRRDHLEIEPRKAWPAGGLPVLGVQGRIPADRQAGPGRALCQWGDAGWGALVARGKYGDGRFDDALVDACAELVRRWGPLPAPGWVTCIPSARRPALVPDFAQRLARALGLPSHEALLVSVARPEQKTMANSAHQALNLDGALRVSGPLPSEPVLLVDDLVDSRWTFTVGAWLLQDHGCGTVWPLALASTGHAS